MSSFAFTSEQLAVLVEAKTLANADPDRFINTVLTLYPFIGIETILAMYPDHFKSKTLIRIDVGGRVFHAEPSDLRKIKHFWEFDKKVDAIKETRSIYGVGLKEAKDFVECFDWSKV